MRHQTWRTLSERECNPNRAVIEAIDEKGPSGSPGTDLFPSEISGTGGGTRTPNQRFWRPLLCQLSYARKSAREDRRPVSPSAPKYTAFFGMSAAAALDRGHSQKFRMTDDPQHERSAQTPSLHWQEQPALDHMIGQARCRLYLHYQLDAIGQRVHRRSRHYHTFACTRLVCACSWCTVRLMNGSG
jgi:hypothetical protein